MCENQETDCAECSAPIPHSFYEHMNTYKRYCSRCFDKLSKANLAFKLLCKLRF